MVLVLACGVSAEEKKIDAKKLVGKWDGTVTHKDKKEEKVAVEYTADGKFTATHGDHKVEGTYKADGKKLTLKSKVKDEEKTMTITVTKLTDDVMEGETDMGDKGSFKKVK